MQRIANGRKLLGNVVFGKCAHECAADAGENISSLSTGFGNEQSGIRLIDFKRRGVNECLQGTFDLPDEAAAHHSARQHQPIESVPKEGRVASRSYHLVLEFTILFGKLLWNGVETRARFRAQAFISIFVGVSRIPIKNDTVLFGDIDDRLNLSVGLDSLGHPANNKILSIEPKRFVVKTRSKRVH